MWVVPRGTDECVGTGAEGCGGSLDVVVEEGGEGVADEEAAGTLRRPRGGNGGKWF